MSPEQFCYWLQGFAELNDAPPTPAQWLSIVKHIQLVFHKVTPPVNPPSLQDLLKPSPMVKQENWLLAGGLPGTVVTC
jgi:hypothetical protein